MKLNISNPTTGCQKLIEIEDEKKLRMFLDKRMSAEVPGDSLGEEFKGYIFKITGGNDKEGFPMKQGVLVNGRVRLLMRKGHSCFRERRSGEKIRKSVRGCITGSDLSVMSLVIVKKGEGELPGLTDEVKPRRLGPKRASKIRKLFNLTKDDDVRKYVIRRELPKKEGKKARTKAPKIQRLVTPVTLQRKRRRISLRKKTIERHKQEAADYAKLLAQRNKEKRQALVSKKRTTSKKSVSVKDAEKKVEKDTKEVKKEAAGKGKKEAAVKTAGKGKKEAAVKTAGKGKKEAAVKAAGKGKKEAAPKKEAAAAPKKEAGKKEAAPKKEAGKKDAAPKKDAPKKEAAGKKEAPKKDAGKKAAAKPAGKSATKK